MPRSRRKTSCGGGRRKRKIPESCVASWCQKRKRKRSVAEERALDERHKDVEAALEKVKTSLTVDLAKVARKELDTLTTFENNSRLFDEEVIRNAIRRYEQCWLPLKN
ncbi:hypothetical protein AAVH_06299 [Aphelenchoides avenae]|nr:hypothetical protein AAVH_06299 [Aphelenchus avenae]